MYITKQTDYSLRTLMLLALQSDGELMSIEEISNTLCISRAHLMKIVHRLAQLDIVETIRGRSGGVRIHQEHCEINVGAVFRQLEEISEIVDCDDGPCVFHRSCKLKLAFKNAEKAFVEELDRYTLADLVKKRSHLQKIVLHDV